jgi:excisionase family DNA binding protein
MTEQNGHNDQDFGALLFPGRRMLYIREVAERLRIAEQQVRNLIEEGKLGAVNIGTHERKFWRIPVEEYERFLKKNFSIDPMQPTEG